MFEHELTADHPRAPQPSWITTPLLDHQQTALHAALAVEQSKTGTAVEGLPGEPMGGQFFSTYGILGDRVGAGKSLIALSMVKHPPPPANIVEYSWRACGSSDNSVGLLRNRSQETSVYGDRLTALSASLFIVPHALMGQWEEYVKRDTTLKALFVKKRKDAQEEDLAAKLPTFDAVFVSATMWRDFEAHNDLSTVLWSRLFVDEADSIAVSLSSERIHARFVWLISASWMNLVFANGAFLNTGAQYMPLPATPTHTVSRMKSFAAGDYFQVEGTRNPYIRKLCGSYGISGYNTSILNAVMFQATRLLVHCSEAYIRASFNIPEITHTRYLCLAPANVQVLRNIISDDMMERLHAGDAEGVLTMLGMTARSTEDVAAAVTESIQKELTITQRLYEFKRTVEYSTEAAKQKALEHLEDKIARLESRIAAIQERLTNTQDQSCPICFCEVVNPALTPCCRNLFCFGCICEVMKRTCVCPLCRESIPNIQSIHVLGSGAAAASEAKDESPQPPKPLTKTEQFRAFLTANPTAKVLMFSAYDATFAGLSSTLEADGVPHATLNGSQARIARLIRDFDAGKYRVLFLNSRNMGAGLNIMPATHVVLFHRMPVEMQNQIVGRAMRMGRTAPLHVVHLLHGNEMTAEETVSEANVIQHI